jgi:D-alanyl-D-alanine carboxypeptidase/D-alanyl-D-alanine-endopeptidase (penicillin-binding protein 4)
MRYLLLLAVAQGMLCAQTVFEKAASLLDSFTTAGHGFWGVSVVDLASGETLYQLQQDRSFLPASTAKLFSSALALERLGAGHRFVTTVTAAQPPDTSGRLQGDLTLVGSGDPTMSARQLPYTKGAFAGNPLEAVEDLADQVVARGVTRIQGDVVGDDTAYPWEPYPEGRVQDDALWEYGAPVSALSVNENRLTLTIGPGRRTGDPAQLRLSPPLEYFVIENRVRTAGGSQARIEVERTPGSRQLRVWGAVPLKSAPVSRLLALDDPAEFAASALYDALTRRGVRIGGRPVAKHRFVDDVPDLKKGSAPAAPAERTELARRLSPPLSDILEVTLKESLNLYAELVLREVARVRRHVGSRQAGIEELESFAQEVGIPAGECSLVDGSGLSVLNLVTPEAATKLLDYMNKSANRETWLSLLPVAGRDGTLRQRLNGTPAQGSIRAKTGSMSHVSALAGYAQATGGRTLAFAVFVNNYTSPASEIRAVIDKICIALVQ